MAKQNYYQLSTEELTNQTISLKQGMLNKTGALCINTGEFTGRSPENKFIVKDKITENRVDWNVFNQPLDETIYKNLKIKILNYFENLDESWVRDAFACTDPNYKLGIRITNDNPWSNLFCNNMFIRPNQEELKNFTPQWQILQAPNFFADPKIDGVPNKNFSIISFTDKCIIIGGSGYTGEMKKGVFSILNFILPTEHQILSMHCSANYGPNNDLSLFFGLSGTGKTTLSADPERTLIGDDEIAWGENTIFNIEGGCYAKTINLNVENEPDIYNAIKPGALVENIKCFPNSNDINFADDSITPNTRVCYPLSFINKTTDKPMNNNPNHIFFLTCDSFGILPPISKLNKAQAMYQFISGYTAKIAGTEVGIKSPKETFSACFGAPFMLLHPKEYAELLGEKMLKHKTEVWLINTGWTGGPFGVGKRIKLSYTRKLIHEVLNGNLSKVKYQNFPVFNFSIPTECQGIPSEILDPMNTWSDKEKYKQEAIKLALKFINNFKQFESLVSKEIISACPVM